MQKIEKFALSASPNGPVLVGNRHTRPEEGAPWTTEVLGVGSPLDVFNLPRTSEDLRYNGRWAKDDRRTRKSSFLLGGKLFFPVIGAKPDFKLANGKGAWEFLLAGEDLYPSAAAPPQQLREAKPEDAMQPMFRMALPFEHPQWLPPERAGRVSQLAAKPPVWQPGDMIVSILLGMQEHNLLTIVGVQPDGTPKQYPLSLRLFPSGANVIRLPMKAKYGLSSDVLVRWGENSPAVRQGGIPRFFVEVEYIDFDPADGKGLLYRPLSQGAIDAGARSQRVSRFMRAFFESAESVFCCDVKPSTSTVEGAKTLHSVEAGEIEVITAVDEEVEAEEAEQKALAEANPQEQAEGQPEAEPNGEEAKAGRKRGGNKMRPTS